MNCYTQNMYTSVASISYSFNIFIYIFDCDIIHYHTSNLLCMLFFTNKFIHINFYYLYKAFNYAMLVSLLLEIKLFDFIYLLYNFYL